MTKPDISHLLEERLRDSLKDMGLEGDKLEAAVKELSDLAKEYARKIK